MKILLTILLVLLLLLVLIALLRVGVILEYSEEGFLALIRIGPLKIKVFPRKEKPEEEAETAKKKIKKKKKKIAKKKKGEKAESDTEEAAEEQPPKKGGRLELILDLLPLIPQLLGGLKRKLLVEEMTVHYTISGRRDPAKAAIFYGRLCAGEGAVTAVLENNLNIKKRHITAQVDFLADQALVYLRLALSYRIGQLVVVTVPIGWRALRIFLRWRKEQKAKQAKQDK